MSPISEAELRRRLDAEGYDIPALERLGQSMGIDLLAILAGWAHILAEVVVHPAAEPPPVRQGFWKRVWRFLNGEW